MLSHMTMTLLSPSCSRSIVKWSQASLYPTGFMRRSPGGLMSQFTKLPCNRCEGKKGPKYIDRKYCGRCLVQIKKERSRGAHARAIFTRYGITGEDYNRLYEFQQGKCALCRWATGKTRRLSVDHDHRTGLVRGLLCRPCNDLLGFIRDNPEYFRRGIDYLDAPPWARLNRRTT